MISRSCNSPLHHRSLKRIVNRVVVYITEVSEIAVADGTKRANDELIKCQPKLRRER